ncbi:MAG TPA: hypothetical protein VFR23_11255, partial [Jiangellaceae bacterium]|nr:hypothetical protein [Jiangellaceae bacterium]
TATARDHTGNPLNRDAYAAQLREQLGEDSPGTGSHDVPTGAQTKVVARLLDELAGVYRGEDLGELAREMSQLLETRLRKHD